MLCFYLLLCYIQTVYGNDQQLQTFASLSDVTWSPAWGCARASMNLLASQFRLTISNDQPHSKIKGSPLATVNMPMTPDQMIRGEEKRYECFYGFERLCQRPASVSTGPVDLTQHIRRVSDHPIAQGGFGDIWKCILTIHARDGYGMVRRWVLR